nr:MAG TPA: hypothetical protein [Caudoviricetes sp.]
MNFKGVLYTLILFFKGIDKILIIWYNIVRILIHKGE